MTKLQKQARIYKDERRDAALADMTYEELVTTLPVYSDFHSFGSQDPMTNSTNAALRLNQL